MTRTDALRLMINTMNGGEGRSFAVGLVGYHIEGQLRPANVLQVDANSAVNFRTTEEGFTCYAFFAPARLTSAIVEANGIQTSPDGAEFVVVMLEVNQKDVWAVFETTGGVKRELFLDYAARETAVRSIAEKLDAARQ